MNKTTRNKKMLQAMIDGIEDEFIEEALMYRKKGVHKRNYFKSVAVAACMCLLLSRICVSALAAKNPEFKNGLKRVSEQIGLDGFMIEETEESGNKGVKISKESDGTNEAKTPKPANEIDYYLNLTYMPEGYKCDKDDSSTFYGKDKKLDYIGVAFFHLQAEFINILPNSKEIKQNDTKNATVYIAKSKWQKRMWIKFADHPYRVEIRDYNNRCSEEELLKLAEGAELSENKGEIEYDQLEWTKDLYESYTKQLEQYK